MTIVFEGQSGLPSPNPTKSYWHKEPSQVLLGHRTTPDLPETADIVIVGSGITGSFASHFLKHGQAKDQSVVLLEAREACWGATGRNGGHCQPFLYVSTPEVAAFELETYHFLKSFIAEHNVPCDWVTLRGCHAYLTDDVWKAASENVAQLQRDHPDLGSQVELVAPGSDDDGGKLTLSALRVPNAKGAIVQKNAASLWPYKLVSYVLERLLEEFPAPSFNLQTTTPVTTIRRDASGPGTGSRWLVSTPRGHIVAKTVLLCTNAYTSRLLPAFLDLIVPVRGQIGALLPPRPTTGTPEEGQGEGEGDPAKLDFSYVGVGNYPPPVTTRDEYLIQRPLPGGELIYGGGRNHARGLAVGEWRDDEVEEEVAAYLRRNITPPLDLTPRGASGQVPGGETELEASWEWTGIMGFSRDHHAWVGPVPESLGGGGEDGGMYVCAGYTGHGMPTAALSARAVVRMMTGDLDAAGGVGLPEAMQLTEDRVRYVRENLETVQAREPKGWANTFPGLLVGGEHGSARS